jgi:hypothetical protein
VAPGDGDVVIGRKQGDQAEDEAAESLDKAETVEPWPVDGF